MVLASGIHVEYSLFNLKGKLNQPRSILTLDLPSAKRDQISQRLVHLELEWICHGIMQ